MFRLHCKNPACGRMFEARSKHAKVCGRPCVTGYFLAVYGPEYFARGAARAQAAATATKRRRANDRLRTKYPDCPPATARMIWTDGYRSGHTQGRREWRKAVA